MFLAGEKKMMWKVQITLTEAADWGDAQANL
jgi:hypothetical protein